MYSEGEIIYHFPLTTQLGQEYQQDIPVAKAKKFRFDFAQAPEETGPGSPDTLPDLDFPGDQRREPAPGTSTAARPRAQATVPGTSSGTRAPAPAPGTNGCAEQGAPTQAPGSGSPGTDTPVPAHGKKLNR